MKTLNIMPKLGALLFLIISIISCQEDFNTIGSDIVGDDSLIANLDNTSTVIAYSRKLAPVQTNIIPVSQLGVYNDGTFGKSTVNYLSQLLLETSYPIFSDTLGKPVVLDSVVLYIPYFNESTIDDEDVITYELDSVYGDSPINIEMYESNYFLRDLDPDSNFEDPQYYYSNQGPEFENFLGENLTTIEDFVPSNQGFVFTEGEGDDEEITKLGPGIRVPLPNDFFQEKILDMEGEPELSNNNNFKNYFRGVYFKASSNTENGSYFLFNTENANITLHYNYETYVEDENNILIKDTIYSDFSLNFGDVNLSLFDNELSPEIASAIDSPNTVEGEESLYVRGGDGIMTVINLFGEDVDDNGVADELEILRDKEWVINDANLKFYVDQSKITGGETEPERITIFNIDDNRVLADYFLDPTSGDEPINAITNHLGRLERDSDGLGVSYKINITHHISNLINKDSTNVSLGLMTSQNVLLNGFQKLDTLQDPNQNLPTIKEAIRNGVISPEGTVFYGNNSFNEDKKLILEIYYTEPN